MVSCMRFTSSSYWGCFCRDSGIINQKAEKIRDRGQIGMDRNLTGFPRSVLFRSIRLVNDLSLIDFFLKKEVKDE
jgi:hypothetical protein